MGGSNYEEYDFNVNPTAPLFIISVVSEMVSLPVWTLRKLDEMGVVRPSRMGKKTRCYSKIQIRQLHHVRYLLKEKKVNISAVKFVIETYGEREAEHG